MRSYFFLVLSLFVPVGSAFTVDPGQAWQAYNAALNTSPLLVKSVTAGVILGAADLTGQAVQDNLREGDEKTDIDIPRAVRFAFFGLVLQAPWNHFYFNLLDGAIPPTADPWTATTAIKTVIDQFVQAPIFTVLIFAFLGFLEGKNLESIKKQLNDDYKDTMVANCKNNTQRNIYSKLWNFVDFSDFYCPSIAPSEVRNRR